MTRRLAGLIALAAAALLVAGCGSSDSSSSDTTAATEWADSLCSAISTYTDSLTSAFEDVKGGSLTEDSVTTAVDDAKSATQTFADSLKTLGTPDTESGQQAKESVDELATSIEADMKTIEDAVADASGITGILAAVPTITSTISAAGTKISDTLSSFQDLDAKGELESAFEDADSCQSLTSGS